MISKVKLSVIQSLIKTEKVESCLRSMLLKTILHALKVVRSFLTISKPFFHHASLWCTLDR